MASARGRRSAPRLSAVRRAGQTTIALGRRVTLVLLAVAAVHGGTAAVHAAPSDSAGSVRELRIGSRHQGRSRAVWVYTAPGSSAGTDTSLGMILAFDARDYPTTIPLPRVLDSLLAAAAIPRAIAVMIDDSTGAARREDFADRAWFVGEDVVSCVRGCWPVSREPRRSSITGSSAGGLPAVHIALRRPDLFGNAISQSGAFWCGSEASNGPPFEWLAKPVTRWPRAPVRLRLQVGSTENQGTMGGTVRSILSANRAMSDTFSRHGYDVTYVEVSNRVHAPETWGPRLAPGIAAILGRP